MSLAAGQYGAQAWANGGLPGLLARGERPPCVGPYVCMCRPQLDNMQRMRPPCSRRAHVVAPSVAVLPDDRAGAQELVWAVGGV